MDWSGWSREAGNRDVLWRIVALLFSLANCADRAAGLRGARNEVLAILLRAEAVAYAFIVDMATGAAGDFSLLPDGEKVAAPCSCQGQGQGLADDGASAPCDSPVACWPEFSGDATGLAVRLRVLALVLWFMLARSRRSAPLGGASRRAGRLKPVSWPKHAGLAGAARYRAAPSSPDTS